MGADKSVLIVGFGIAGMSAALAFKQAGWTPTIIEKAPGRRKGGYFVGLFPPGKEAARSLGVFDHIHFRTPRGSETWDIKDDGSRIFSPGFLDQPGDIEGVLRSDLEAGLWKAVEGQCDIRFDTVPLAITDRGDAVDVRLRNTVTDEERAETYDLVIGADGVRSTVRSLVFGPHEAFLKSLRTMICAFEMDEAIPSLKERDGIMICEVDRALWVFPLSDKAPTALFTYRVKDIDAQFRRSPADTLREVYGGADHREIFDAVLDQFDKHQEYLFDSVNKVIMKRWHKGRVVMLGDAAWCLTLYSGMGASSAMKGAVELARSIAESPDDIAAALVAWEKHMRPFIRKHRIATYMKTQVFVPSTRIFAFLRHRLMRLGARSLAKKRRGFFQQGVPLHG